MNKILKSAVLSGSILAMALTPGLILSTQDNQQTEYKEVKSEEPKSTTGNDKFKPTIVELNLTPGSYDEQVQTIETEIEDEKAIEWIRMNMHFSATSSQQNKDEEFFMPHLDLREATNYKFKIEYQLSESKGLRIRNIVFEYDLMIYDSETDTFELEEHTEYSSNWSLAYVPYDIATGSTEDLIQFSDTLNDYWELDNWSWQPYLVDGNKGMYVELSPYGGSDNTYTINPVLLHFTWPEKFNTEETVNNKVDIWYENKDSNTLNSELWFKIKNKNFTNDTYIGEDLFGNDMQSEWDMDRMVFSTHYKMNDGKYIQLEFQNYHPSLWEYLYRINQLTNVVQLPNFDLLSREIGATFDSSIWIDDDYYYSDWAAEFKIYEEIPEASTFTTVAEYYDYIDTAARNYALNNYEVIDNDGNGYMDYQKLNSGTYLTFKTSIYETTASLTLTEGEDGKVYMGYPLWMTFNEISYANGDPLGAYRDLVTSSIGFEQYEQIINNAYLNTGFSTRIQMPIPEIVNGDSTTWQRYKQFINLDIVEDGVNQEHFKTSNEILVIVLSSLSFILLALMIILLLRKGAIEDSSAKVISKKGGDK